MSASSAAAVAYPGWRRIEAQAGAVFMYRLRTSFSDDSLVLFTKHNDIRLVFTDMFPIDIRRQLEQPK